MTQSTKPQRTPDPTARSAAHRSGCWPLLSADEMQALDRRTIEDVGIPGEVLMESAGRGLVATVLELARARGRSRLPIRAFCGTGNNGGDGFVLVRHLHAEGVATEAVLLGDPDRLPPDAALNWRRLAQVGASHRVAADDLDAAALLDETAVAVDAIFGTGLARPVEGRLATWIAALNAARGRGLLVVSVDLPSGICADTGRVLGVAVEADRTLTISLPKIGLALEPGRSDAGDVRVVRVGIVDPAPQRLPRAELWNARAAARCFPSRPRSGHKGSFGHVLVAAGSPGKLGAGALCTRAALRGGAGLVTLAYPAGLDMELAGVPVEAMSQAMPSTPEGVFASEATKALIELAASRDVVALGPGLGRAASLREFVPDFVAQVEAPMVIDADGLYAFRGQLERLHERGGATVLTPHPGEAATLLDGDARMLNDDRVAAARELAARSGSIVILKGAASVIANPAGRALITPTGGPALATGGTGDVLTGIVAALLGQGLDAFEAAGLAAWWHGAAADRLVRNRLPPGSLANALDLQAGVSGLQAGALGLLASEVADGLPASATELIAALAGSNPRQSDEEGAGEGLELRFPGP